MKRVTTQFVDDLVGEVIAEGAGGTVRFSLDGQSYELDLSADNAARLREALAPFVAAARRVGSRSTAARTPRSSSDTAGLQAIREWANANGQRVADRGRIAVAVREAYAAAQLHQ